MKTLKTYFSDDIWFQMFPYFPLILIFKFRCVSKLWNLYLSSPDFIHRWIQINNTNLPWMLIYIFKQKSFRKFSLAYPDHHSHFISNHSGFSFEFLSNPNSSTYSTLYLLGSSNGLILCSRNRSHYVCNPLTQKWVEIPPPPPQSDMGILSTLSGFVCDCSSALTSYKVVRILTPDCDTTCFSIQVFSSDSGKWNFYNVFCSDDESLRFTLGAHDGFPKYGVIIHNNVLYWVDGYNRLVAYDLENNASDFRQCRLINLPDWEFGLTRCLGESKGCLGQSNGSIFYGRINRRQETLCIWVLQEEENLHLVHNDIDLSDLFAEFNMKLNANIYHSRWGNRIEVFGFSPVDSNVVLVGYKNYIWAYNIGSRKYDELCHPTFMGNEHSASSDIDYLPLVFKPMPTILPPRSW